MGFSCRGETVSLLLCVWGVGVGDKNWPHLIKRVRPVRRSRNGANDWERREADAELYKCDRFGSHYDIKFTLRNDVGSSLILSCWIIRIIRTDEDVPRLTNTYPI